MKHIRTAATRLRFSLSFLTSILMDIYYFSTGYMHFQGIVRISFPNKEYIFVNFPGHHKECAENRILNYSRTMLSRYHTRFLKMIGHCAVCRKSVTSLNYELLRVKNFLCSKFIECYFFFV